MFWRLNMRRTKSEAKGKRERTVKREKRGWREL